MSSKLHCTFIFDSLLAGLGRNQVYGESAQKARKSVITRQQALRAYCSNMCLEVQYAMENHKFVMPSSTCLALQWLREFVATAQFLI